MIQVRATKFPEAQLFVPHVFEDDRGLLSESYSESNYAELGLKTRFVQDLVTWSGRNVLRGPHYDLRMAKFVQVLKGIVFDVIVDMRKESPQYKQWEGYFLSDHNHHQLYVPPGFAHGFLVLADEVIFHYKMSAQHDLAHEHRIAWDDPSIGIAWPIVGEPRISAKDRAPT